MSRYGTRFRGLKVPQTAAWEAENDEELNDDAEYRRRQVCG